MLKKPTGEDWLSLAMSDKNYDPTNERSQQATEQQAKALEMMDKKAPFSSHGRRRYR